MEDLLAAIIRRDRGVSERLTAVDPATIRAAAEEHGLLALVADALAELDDVPARLQDCFAGRAQELAAVDLVRESELRSLLEALQASSLSVLLMKGAHLAYSHYPRPDLRPRLDTDVLIDASARRETEVVLHCSGYHAIAEQQQGDLLMYQSTYLKVSGETRHTVDLHWRALNPHVFADVLHYRSLAASSVPLPKLGRAARGLDGVHALLLACVHRVAHHSLRRPLIWIYDIHLLACACDEVLWQRFLAEADQAGVGSICQEGLRLAASTFGTKLPPGLLDDPRLTRAPDVRTAGYLRPSRHAQMVLADLRSLPDWASRSRLAQQYLFPRAEYMRQTYAPGSALPLSVLYLLRIWRGGRRWMKAGSERL